MRQGCIYLMTCTKCETEGGRSSYYVGESARTPYDRGLEHLAAMRRWSQDSPLVEHYANEHQGEEADFTMKILQTPTTNLLRQTGEFHQMQKYSELGVLLNRRGEWGQNLPPRLVVDESEIRGAKRGRGQEPNGAGGCRRGTMVDANPPPPSPPPNPGVPKRIRKTGPNSVLQPLEDRIKLDPKAPKILTVKEMLQKLSDRAT